MPSAKKVEEETRESGPQAEAGVSARAGFGGILVDFPRWPVARNRVSGAGRGVEGSSVLCGYITLGHEYLFFDQSLNRGRAALGGTEESWPRWK